MAVVKKQRNYRRKVVDADDSLDVVDSPSNDSSDTQQEENVSYTIEELNEMRRLRRRQRGVDAEKLLKGLVKKNKPKAKDPLKVGGLVDRDAFRSGRSTDDDDGKAKAVKLDTFTTQTNALDVDKHMMTYIESEMRKRRGGRLPDDDEEEEEMKKPQGLVDIYEELYRLPSRMQSENKQKQEGSVQLSAQMLTAIPEVDLGINAQLKNIEDTERAKRKLMDYSEQDSNTSRVDNGNAHLEDVPANFEKQILKKENPRMDKRQMATDEAVAERFRKRMRNQQ